MPIKPKQTVVRLKNVTKTYGSARGVSNLSLEVKKGEVFGFLGPNGAGKSTTIQLLIDLLRPSEGSIQIFGMDSIKDSLAIRRRVGFLAGDMALDKRLNGWQQLEYYGRLHGVFNKAHISELAERLNCDLSRRFNNLSRGNKQKVGLIAALMHQPELLILDEPTSGLDPLIQAEFNKIIIEEQKRGVTVFISSHVLSEVQALCHRVGFIRSGELVAVKDMKDIAKNAPKVVHISGLEQARVKQILALKGIGSFQDRAGKTSFTVAAESLNGLLQILGKRPLRDVSISDADLETIFMHYYQKEQDYV